MRYKPSQERRAVILMVVLALLTLFAIVGISFVLYADAEATSARVAREAENQSGAGMGMDPQQALALFLSQFLYGVPDSAVSAGSGLRGHDLARTIYGYNSTAANIYPFNGIGRLHYTYPSNGSTPLALQGQDDYTLINYTWFQGDGFIRFPERYNGTPGNNPANAATYPYIGGNPPYTYPDLNNFFLAAVKADGTVLAPSFHRNYTGFGSLDPKNPNWIYNPNLTAQQNAALKYQVLRPRPAEHPSFPLPADAGGDVKNLVWAPGGNDSIWIDIGAPVMTAPDGTQYKMLIAPLILDLDGRINLNTAGNILAYLANSTTSPSVPHVSNQGWGSWEVNLAKVLYGNNTSGSATQGSPNITVSSTASFAVGDTVTVAPNPLNPPNVLTTTVTSLTPNIVTLATPWTQPSGNVTIIDQTEWTRIFTGRTLASQTIPGRYVSNGNNSYTPTTNSTSIPLFSNAFSLATTFPHFYTQADYNGLNESSTGTASSQLAPPGFGGTATSCFPTFASGYANGGTASGVNEDLNHPLLFDVFRWPLAQSIGTRVFRPSDMESLLRPNNYANGNPVDPSASGIISDLVRLCPYNFGISATSLRYSNLVTTLSMDLGLPGVTPYWYSSNGTPQSPSTPQPPYPATPMAPTTATTFTAPVSNAVPFPTITVGNQFPPVGNSTSPTPPPPNPSEFAANLDWRALSAALGRIRLNQPLPPYPHMGQGLLPPYNYTPMVTWGTAYDTSGSNKNDQAGQNSQLVLAQYNAALTARQNLANQIYRTLVALVGLTPATPKTPSNTDLASRRWLAQLAVNIVDFIDEDDISTPFNFYTTQDDASFTPAANPPTQGGDETNANAQNQSGNNNTGANPLYWVFGTELPKVVLNEVLAEAMNTDTTQQQLPNENVKLWIELYNTMQSGLPNTVQQQDQYRVPLYMNSPAGGAGYSPYRISIAQSLMIPSPPATTSPLPDASANVLGKAYIASPFPQSTTDNDFNPSTLNKPGNPTLTSVDGKTTGQPAPANGQNIWPGVDPQSFFLLGPQTVDNTLYQDPFVAQTGMNPGVPPNTSVLRTDNVSYTVPASSWQQNSTNDERTTGLTVMLRRLANPYLPFQGDPTKPYYNPYITVDYLQNVPIQSNGATLNKMTNMAQPPMMMPSYSSRVKHQPFAAYTSTNPANTQTTTTQTYSPVQDIPGGTAGAAKNNNVTHTFGIQNVPLSSTKSYDWLVHLDRAPISPMELLHVSGYPPYMLTQQFVVPTATATGDNNTAVNMFHHYVPWLDYLPPGSTSASLAAPWWFDSNLQQPGSTTVPSGQTHRLYRLFEFLECGDRAAGVWGNGRIPGKVNINTVWDAEILQALIDANSSIGINANPPNSPTNTNDPVAQIFANMIQSRSPSYYDSGKYDGTVGAVNMGTGSDDHPFLPLSTGLTPSPANGGSQQFSNGVSLLTDTLLRVNPSTNTLLLFQNPNDATSRNGQSPPYVHPYQQTQLLNKLYNNVTTRSNVFAVFLTVGFFQVTGTVAGSNIPQLGPEIGRSEGRQIRHRMFAIVDRTNLSVFSTNSNTPVAAPSIPTTANPNATNNPTGQATITLNSPLPATLQVGTQLVIEPGTDNEEVVFVQSINAANNQVTANFTKPHPNPAVTGNPSPTYTIMQRGNPGPKTTYDPRLDPLVVPYFSIID